MTTPKNLSATLDTDTLKILFPLLPRVNMAAKINDHTFISFYSILARKIKSRNKKNEQGDQLYSSRQIDELWGRNNPNEAPTLVGPVNLQTAGYVCRYQLKKQEHGAPAPGQPSYDPIVRYSSKYAIGKAYIEKNWQRIFSLGYISVQGGEKLKIPRYYEKWLKDHQPEMFKQYVTGIRYEAQKKYGAIQEKEELEYLQRQFLRSAHKGLEIKQNKMREIILEQKTKNIKQKEL